MKTLHVGVGARRGALTVFPIWGEFAPTPVHDPSAASLAVREVDGAARVDRLQVTNAGPRPVLLFQGQVVEGGRQHRALVGSQVVGAGSRQDVDVVCVEQGRWSGADEHVLTRRRVSSRVRAGLSEPAAQHAVWDRVAEYESTAATATQSWVEHAERRAGDVERLVQDVVPLPGQVGVAIGLAGQPFSIDVFDRHETLLAQHDSIVRAAAFDALTLVPEVTPARRVQRLVRRAAMVSTSHAAAAGLGTLYRGRDELVERAVLRWAGADAHLQISNVRHQLHPAA